MPDSRPLTEFLREHKTVMVLVTIGLLLLEIEIFALAALKSGRQSRLEVYNSQGQLIYETDGRNLSQFNRYYFEKTFGPLERYDVRLSRQDRPFPFRAWFVAAVGIPVGAVLLFAFVVRAGQGIFYGERRRRPPDDDGGGGDHLAENRLNRIFGQISRLNIFALGALILVAVLTYWIVPNLIVYLGQVGLQTLLRFKWFFIVLALSGFGLVVWIIYLRYLLARKTIESRVQVEKYRLQLEFDRQADLPKLLEYAAGSGEATAAGPPRQEDR